MSAFERPINLLTDTIVFLGSAMINGLASSP